MKKPPPNTSPASVAVLGAGSFGTALAILLAKNGVQVRLWGHTPTSIAQMRKARCNPIHLPDIPFPPHIELFTDLREAVADTDTILIVVPSYAFHDLLTQLKPLLSAHVRLLWGTKGLDSDTGELLHSLAQTILVGHHQLAILSGPSFAREVALGKPTAVTIASTDKSFAQELAQLFTNTTFRVYTSEDMVGVEICGIVKNTVAIAAGAIHALALGANAQAALITRSLAEMQRLGLAMGAKPATFMGLAGLGDLVLTCTDNQSRNRRFGYALGAGKTTQQAIKEIGLVEGMTNLKGVYTLSQRHHVDTPIITQIYRVIYEGLPLNTAITDLFTRELKSESSAY